MTKTVDEILAQAEGARVPEEMPEGGGGLPDGYWATVTEAFVGSNPKLDNTKMEGQPVVTLAFSPDDDESAALIAAYEEEHGSYDAIQFVGSRAAASDDGRVVEGGVFKHSNMGRVIRLVSASLDGGGLEEYGTKFLDALGPDASHVADAFDTVTDVAFYWERFDDTDRDGNVRVNKNGRAYQTLLPSAARLAGGGGAGKPKAKRGGGAKTSGGRKGGGRKAQPTPATPDADTIAALQALAEESDTHADFLTGVADAFPDLADTYSEWYAAEVVAGGEQQLGPDAWEA